MAAKTNLECVPELTSVNDCFQTDALSKRSKERGYNFFVNGYIHSVSIFSQKDSDSIDVRGRCYRSMRKSETPHTLTLTLSSVGKTTESHCSCVAGMSGTCAHIVGLVFTIIHYQQLGLKEVPCELSCTSLPQQWHKPRGGKISPVALSTMTFAKPKATRKRRPVLIQQPDSSLTVSSPNAIKQLRSDPDLPLSYLLDEKIENHSTPYGTFQRGSMLHYQLQHHVQHKISVTSTSCGDVMFPRDTYIELDDKYKGLKEKYTIDLNKARELEQNTVRQSLSDIWFKERSKRLTASNFAKVYKRKKAVNEAFLRSVFKPNQFHSSATSYGTSQECNAKGAFAKQYPSTHIHDCGLVVNPCIPFLGASPDGKICVDNRTGIMEIKCPYSARDMTIAEALSDLENFCLHNSNQKISLKSDHDYYFQIQGQLLVTGAEFCEFIVYTKKDLFCEKILPDTGFQKDMMKKLCDFFLEHALDFVVNM